MPLQAVVVEPQEARLNFQATSGLAAARCRRELLVVDDLSAARKTVDRAGPSRAVAQESSAEWAAPVLAEEAAAVWRGVVVPVLQDAAVGLGAWWMAARPAARENLMMAAVRVAWSAAPAGPASQGAWAGLAPAGLASPVAPLALEQLAAPASQEEPRLSAALFVWQRGAAALAVQAAAPASQEASAGLVLPVVGLASREVGLAVRPALQEAPGVLAQVAAPDSPEDSIAAAARESFGSLADAFLMVWIWPLMIIRRLLKS